MLIESYAWKSYWRDYHPLEKLSLALVVMILCFYLSQLILQFVLWLIVFFLTIKGGVRLSDYLKIYILPAGFLVFSLVGIALVFNPADTCLLSFKIGMTNWGITSYSLRAASEVGIRTMIMIGALTFLALSTPVLELVSAFQGIGAKGILCEIIYISYRIIAILLEVGERIVRAEYLRLGYVGFRQSLRSVVLLVFGLFRASMARYQEMKTVVEARGVEAKIPVVELYQPLNFFRLAAIWGSGALVVVLSKVLGGV